MEQTSTTPPLLDWASPFCHVYTVRRSYPHWRQKQLIGLLFCSGGGAGFEPATSDFSPSGPKVTERQRSTRLSYPPHAAIEPRHGRLMIYAQIACARAHILGGPH